MCMCLYVYLHVCTCMYGWHRSKSFHVITQLGVWRLWWFNYPGPLLEVELESACLSGQGCGLCIYSFDSTQPLGCLGGSVVRASVW